MIFIYPYKRKENDFLISHSIRLVKKHYPDAGIYTVGDKVEGASHIEHKDSHIIRGVNVTSKVLHAANIFKEFVYMNDDFFINDKFDLNCVYGSNEHLERKEGKASIAWNQAVDNTSHWLGHNGYDLLSYECHQPVLFNSKKLIETFEQVAWKQSDHFIKSIYFNVNVPGDIKHIPNTKLIRPETWKAEQYLNDFGCFSVGQGFMTEEGANFIKQL